jgi:hypothetical protein
MTFPDVSADTMTALRAKLVSTHQAEIEGDNQAGTISGHGVDASYTWDEATQSLAVTVIHHPFYITIATIVRQLADAVAEARGTALLSAH